MGVATVRAAIVFGQRTRLRLAPGMSDHDRRAVALDLLQVRRPVGAIGAGTDRQGRSKPAMTLGKRCSMATEVAALPLR